MCLAVIWQTVPGIRARVPTCDSVNVPEYRDRKWESVVKYYMYTKCILYCNARRRRLSSPAQRPLRLAAVGTPTAWPETRRAFVFFISGSYAALTLTRTFRGTPRNHMPQPRTRGEQLSVWCGLPCPHTLLLTWEFSLVLRAAAQAPPVPCTESSRRRERRAKGPKPKAANERQRVSPGLPMLSAAKRGVEGFSGQPSGGDEIPERSEGAEPTRERPHNPQVNANVASGRRPRAGMLHRTILAAC